MPQNLLESRISSFSLWENTDEYSVMHNLAYEERDHIERELNSYGCKSSLIGLRFGLSGEWQSYMNEARDFNIRDKTACWHETRRQKASVVYSACFFFIFRSSKRVTEV